MKYSVMTLNAHNLLINLFQFGECAVMDCDATAELLDRDFIYIRYCISDNNHVYSCTLLGDAYIWEIAQGL